MNSLLAHFSFLGIKESFLALATTIFSGLENLGIASEDDRVELRFDTDHEDRCGEQRPIWQVRINRFGRGPREKTSIDIHSVDALGGKFQPIIDSLTVSIQKALDFFAPVLVANGFYEPSMDEEEGVSLSLSYNRKGEWSFDFSILGYLQENPFDGDHISVGVHDSTNDFDNLRINGCYQSVSGEHVPYPEGYEIYDEIPFDSVEDFAERFGAWLKDRRDGKKVFAPEDQGGYEIEEWFLFREV